MTQKSVPRHRMSRNWVIPEESIPIFWIDPLSNWNHTCSQIVCCWSYFVQELYLQEWIQTSSIITERTSQSNPDNSTISNDKRKIHQIIKGTSEATPRCTLNRKQIWTTAINTPVQYQSASNPSGANGVTCWSTSDKYAGTSSRKFCHRTNNWGITRI